MMGITVFRNRMTRFSTLKYVWLHFAYDQVKKRLQWHVMTQIDNKFESTNAPNHMFFGAFGKRVCGMQPQSSNQIGQYLKYAPYR